MMMPSIFNDSFFEPWFDFSMPNAEKALYGKRAGHLMKTDIKEQDDSYEVSVDLPGFSKDEVSAELKDGYLTIRAEKSLDKDEKDKKDKYIRRERYEGSMSRSFYVGKNITQEDIKASYRHGILTLNIPKKNPEEEKKQFVMIEG